MNLKIHSETKWFGRCIRISVHVYFVDVRKSQYFPTRNNKFRFCSIVFSYYYFYYLLNVAAIQLKKRRNCCGQSLRDRSSLLLFLFLFLFLFRFFRCLCRCCCPFLFCQPLITKQNEWCKCVRLAHARTKHGFYVKFPLSFCYSTVSHSRSTSSSL